MNYIERYVYDVVRRLPEKMRLDVQQELEGQIYDMLGEDTSAHHIQKVLEELGNPSELAAHYRGQSRYLISPLYYDRYKKVLTIVLTVVALVSLFVGAIEGAVEGANRIWYEMIGLIIGQAIGNTINGLFAGFGIVTLIFAILEYKQVKLQKEPWSLQKLPQIPTTATMTIPRTKATIAMMASIIFPTTFVLILMRYPNLIGWYENGTLIAVFFQEATIQLFIPFFIASIAIETLLRSLQIIKGAWTLRSTAIWGIYRILEVVLMSVFVLHPNLIHPDFIHHIGIVFEISPASLYHPLEVGRSILVAIFVITTLIELGELSWRLYRNQKQAGKIV